MFSRFFFGSFRNAVFAVTVPTASYAIGSKKLKKYSTCVDEPTDVPKIEAITKVFDLDEIPYEDDPTWDVEKEKCSFCKQFLASPCKKQFKLWSICVDKAKESNMDYISACTLFTGQLLDCTSENSDYFAPLAQPDEKSGEDDGDDDDDSDDTNSVDLEHPDDAPNLSKENIKITEKQHTLDGSDQNST